MSHDDSSQVEMSEHDSSQPEMSESGFISDLSTPLYSAWAELTAVVSFGTSIAKAEDLPQFKHGPFLPKSDLWWRSGVVGTTNDVQTNKTVRGSRCSEHLSVLVENPVLGPMMHPCRGARPLDYALNQEVFLGDVTPT